MTIAARIRATRTRVKEAERELQYLKEYFVYHHVTRKREARALAAMRKQVAAIVTRLNNMAESFDILGFS